MAPIKFEENIKDKLEKRTLSPASDSWSKLSDRLDNDEKKSKKPIFWWLGIAASLLIMVALSIQFFNTNESEDVVPQLVEEEAIKEQLSTETSDLELNESIELANEENRVEETKAVLPTQNNPKIVNDKIKTTNNSEVKTQLAEINEPKINEVPDPINETIINIIPNEINDTIIENALAEAMKTLKSENTSVTDREIDSLLKIASTELFKENLKKETSTMVNATKLLESVEDEMGQSFRTKVFEALKESYETVKTAVADRNN